MDNTEIAAEAVDIANELGAVLQGRNTVACFIALSMVLGASAAMAERPDFDGMMKRIETGARDSFFRALKEQGRAPAAVTPSIAWVPTHQHLKTLRLYRVVIGHAHIEATMEAAVVYDNAAGLTFVRPASEFYDGRFLLMNGGASG